MPFTLRYNLQDNAFLNQWRSILSISQNKKNTPNLALVTGASRRIGFAIAISLAESGCDIAVHHFTSDDEADALCEQLRALGVKAHAFAADLSNTKSTRKLFKDVQNKMGTIDLLVNNASVFEDDKVTDLDDDLWDRHFNIHVKAPSVLAGEMAKQDDLSKGLIVNLIDQRVWKLTPQFYSYTLSKSALWAATQTLAQGLAPNIRVNAIAPGPTLANERQSDADFKKQVDGLLLKKGPELTEFGSTILYLFNSPSITGQMIALDGGQHLAWETPDIIGIKE
ncbi:MAG: SDR family oxidoreductase [Rhizobiales bacterium]|nr:SDR family oxidoreductase [Hyphomicrobiales bacterium]